MAPRSLARLPSPLVPEAAVKEVAATPSEEPIAAEPVPEVPEAVESAVPSFTQGDRPSVIEPVAIWPLPAEDAAAEAEALHITIPASETAPEAIEEPATVEAEAVESAVVPEAAEAEEPTQVLEAKGHEGVSPSDFLAPAPAEALAEREIAEPVAGVAPVGVAEPEVVAPAAEAEPEAVEPMVEEPEEQEPEAVEPPGEARAEMEPAGDVVAPAAVEEAGDVTEPIPAADLVAAPAADVTVAELPSEAAAAAAGLTQPLAVWPAPEELESWPSRTRVETHPEPETTVPELVAEEGVDEDPEPAALAEPVADEAPELVAEQADATPGPDDEKPAELDAMAGGAALMNADDLEPPMETTATPDLEAQTAAQPSDEAASALISEPVEPQTEEEKAQIDQADMRRRIEETRNRLKAKAFDAMASGEAALLARDAEGHEAPVVPEEHIDADVADALDRSLSPDDY